MPQRHDNSNPLWQGPCAEGPLGGVTQSMLGRFFSCRERFRLKYVLGLEPHDRWNHRLGYGNMWHVCEEMMAQGMAWEGALNAHTRDMVHQYPTQVQEIEKWWNVCKVQFPEYISYWSDHPDVLNRTPLMQEQVFDVPYTLPSGRVVRLRGKWDSVDLIQDPEQPQGIYLQENKTKGDIDKEQVERQLKFDLQTMLYLVALCECEPTQFGLPDETLPIFGVRYNVVRRPLSGGKGNIRPTKMKSTKLTYTPAEGDEAFYERLRSDYIAKEPDYWFFRIRCEISQHDIQVFRETCLDPLLETLCWWYESVTKEVYTIPSHHLVERAMNYRTPFGIYNSLAESGATEYDAYLATGSEAGLRKTEELFPELK